MSTQSAGGAEFLVLPEESQQQFRLLELPPELLEILTRADARPIYFKSGSTSAGGVEGTNAALCTDGQTYNVRQVNTSNSVFIIQPSQNDNGSGAPISSIKAVAKGDFTYELSKAKTTPNSAIPYIKAALPIYSSTGTYQDRDLVTKAEIFANIPFSDKECNTGWKGLACFELDGPEGCFIPSGEAKVQAWETIIQRSQEFEVDIIEPFSTVGDTLLIDPASDCPEALLKAILNSLAGNNDVEGEVQLNETQTVEKAGLWTLEAATQSRGSIKLSQFMEEWKDLLPEKWREKASLEYLKNQYELVNGGKEIRLDSAGSGNGEAKDQSGAGEAKSLGAKRKWHEKFRASKKTA